MEGSLLLCGLHWGQLTSDMTSVAVIGSGDMWGVGPGHIHRLGAGRIPEVGDFIFITMNLYCQTFQSFY